MLFYILQKNSLTKVAYVLKMHASFLDPVLSGTFVTPIS